jgi:hypothetical protein
MNRSPDAPFADHQRTFAVDFSMPSKSLPAVKSGEMVALWHPDAVREGTRKPNAKTDRRGSQ